VAAAAPADAAAGADAAQPVAGQLTRHVAVLRGAPDGSHTMTLVLTPETLGPVEVQVTVSKGTVDLTLRGAHEHGRAALLDALPDLRRDLQMAGLTPARLEVDRETGGAWTNAPQTQQGTFADRGPQHGRGQEPGDGRSRPWPGAADTDTRVASSARPTTSRSTSPGVDVRV
jgi:flagellar hook-length control protein FliK